MKRFKFKLARLARVRAVQEELARAQWQSAEQRAAQARTREDQGRAAILEGRAELRQMQSNAQIDPHLVLTGGEAIVQLEERLRSLESLREVAEQEAIRLREPWRALRAELEGLKRLEARAHTKFRIESERDEAKQMDERAQGQFQRHDPLRMRNSA